MRLTPDEFFFLLRERLKMTSRHPACGVLYLKEKKRKGKKPKKLLAMRRPDKEEGGRDITGEEIEPINTEITIPLDALEFFVSVLFYGVEFDMDLWVEPEDG